MDNSKWVYYNPEFECEQVKPEVYLYSPWVGHRRFAYDFVRNIKLKNIVELGSHYGSSAFAFLQAIKDGGLDTAFYGIDTWQGDSFTESDYEQDIYGHYKTVNDRFFGDVNSTMVRSLFDDAVEKFEDGSIELLHIDGSHLYEDVKNDYFKWKDKVSETGIIFFHDIGSDMDFGELYGSHYFWEELKKTEPYTMEMLFSHGLGILFRSEEMYQKVKEAVDISVYQNYVNLQDSLNKDVIRKDYFRIRDLESYNADLRNQIAILNEHLNKYSEDVEAKKNYIAQLEKDVAALNEFADSKEKYIQELLKEKESLTAFAQSKEDYARKLEKQLEKRKE